MKVGKKEVAEVLNIICKLNGELETQDFVESGFWFETNGDCIYVKFYIGGAGEVKLWDSADDERDWDGEREEFEDLEGYIRNTAKEALKEAVEQAKHVKL